MDDSLSLKPPSLFTGKKQLLSLKVKIEIQMNYRFYLTKIDNKSKLRLLGVTYGILADDNIRSRANLFCDDDALMR